jgi:hypothetical protein
MPIFERKSYTTTTGDTGNISTGLDNNGKTYILAPYASGGTVSFEAWVSPSNNMWYLTAKNPQTGATINNAEVQVRYLVLMV